tara:strand:+ start:151 stop:516 length:366 start_codon:yes stop_codon:yes gene_type:complete
MNEYKEKIIQELMAELCPLNAEIEVEVWGGTFTAYMTINDLLDAGDDPYDNWEKFDKQQKKEVEIIFDEVQHQTIIGASSSDIREITVAMVIYFYKNQFDIDVTNHVDMKKIVEEVFGYPK